MPSVDIDPVDFAVVLAMHRALGRATRASMGGSLTDYRVLACVEAYDGSCRGVDACRELEISRSAASMALARLGSRGQLTYRDAGGGRRATATDAGRVALGIAHSALADTLSRESPAMSEAEHATHERLMAALADRLGTHLLSDRGTDMVNAHVGICSRTERIIRQNAVAHGLTANAFLVLCGLVGWGGPLSPGELSARLRLPRPLVTDALARLVGAGLASERVGKADARAKEISATPEGDAALRCAVDDFWSAFFARTRPLTDKELAFFRALNARGLNCKTCRSANRVAKRRGRDGGQARHIKKP